MLSVTSRKNLITILRRDLCLGTGAATRIVDHHSSDALLTGPIHEARLVVDQIWSFGRTCFVLTVGDRQVGTGVLAAGALDKWNETPEGVAFHKAIADKDAAENAKMRNGRITRMGISERWAGFVEVEIDGDTLLPGIPCPGESMEELIELYQDAIDNGDGTVRMRIEPASSFMDGVADGLPADQPCIDYMYAKIAA